MFDAAFFMQLVSQYGYFGAFLGSLVSSLSLFFPVPSFLFTIAAGTLLNPFWVGIIAGTGAAIGEMIGYPIGRGISYGLKKKKKSRVKSKFELKLNRLIKKWFDRKLGPVIIFLFAVSPLPDDFVVIFCGIIKYDVKRLFISMLAGKIVFSLVLAYAGYYGIDILLAYF